MITITCTLQGEPTQPIPAGTLAKIHKGTSLFCYDNIAEFEADLLIKLPTDPAIITRQTRRRQLETAETFGKELYYEWAADTIELGIQSETTILKLLVRSRSKDITDFLKEGALDLAINAIKAVTGAQLDAKYLTAARLLTLRNKIHVQLSIPTVLTYNA